MPNHHRLAQRTVTEALLLGEKAIHLALAASPFSSSTIDDLLLHYTSGIELRLLGQLTQVTSVLSRPNTTLPLLLTTCSKLLLVSKDSPHKHWKTSSINCLALSMSASAAIRRYLNRDPLYALPILRGLYLYEQKPLEVMRKELRHLRGNINNTFNILSRNAYKQSLHFTSKKSNNAASVYREDIFKAQLSRYRVREWVRITSKSFNQTVHPIVICNELSILADAIVESSTKQVLRRERSLNGPRAIGSKTQTRFSVIALGKLGAQELNLSSDIDLQMIYSRDGEDASGTTMHQRYTAIAQSIVHTLSQSTPYGYCYRVDMDLRPEGTRGALVNSLAASERYYETWGRHWERIALQRARGVGGSNRLSNAYIRLLKPFCRPRTIDEKLLQNTQSMLDRINQETVRINTSRHDRISHRRRGKEEKRTRQNDTLKILNVKLSQGGIRTIELYIQALQIIHGARDTSLYRSNFSEALQVLQHQGILSNEEGNSLRRHYTYLRHIENTVQGIDDCQTHTLPVDHKSLNFLADLLGFRGENSGLKLHQQVKETLSQVSDICLWEPPSQRENYPHEIHEILAGNGREEHWKNLNFAFPKQALSIWQFLKTSPHSPFTKSIDSSQRQTACHLLAAICAAPSPDLALRTAPELFNLLKNKSGYRKLLNNKEQCQRLFTLLGASEFLGRTLSRNAKFLETIVHRPNPSAILTPPSKKMLEQLLDHQLLIQGGNLEADINILCAFKLEYQLQIATAMLASLLDTQSVLSRLALLAEVILAYTLKAIVRDMGHEFTSLSVIAFGRLGGGEMGFGSDLDLLFLYPHAPHEQNDNTTATATTVPIVQIATKIAKKLISVMGHPTPSGKLYTIDTRLRPSGSRGPLVVSDSAFILYHKDYAKLWERQALLKSRVITGDIVLGEETLKTTRAQYAGQSLPVDTAQQMDSMRSRLAEAQITQSSPLMKKARRAIKTTSKIIDIKFSPGGIVALDFILQYFQLIYGNKYRVLLSGGSLETLNRLKEFRLISKETHSLLLGAYVLLRQVENTLRLMNDDVLTTIHFASPRGNSLARALGYSSGELLFKAINIELEKVKIIYDKVLLSSSH